MARLVQAACPNCGAAVSLDANAEWITCSYCGTSAFIQRTQRAGSIAPPTGAPVIVVSAARGPLAALIVPVIVLALVVIGGAVTAFGLKDANAVVTGAPMAGDANGDGIDDVVVMLIGGSDVSELRFVAYDPVDGDEIWRTGVVGSSNALANFRAATYGGRLLVAKHDGLEAFDLRTGKSAWTARLSESAVTFCERSQSVAVLTKDEQLHDIDVATGALGRAAPGSRSHRGPGEQCLDLAPAQHEVPRRSAKLDESSFRDRVPGMRVSEVHRMADPRQLVALGHRDKGTRVPMIALFSGDRLLWSADVPQGNPLLAAEGEPEAFAAGPGRLIAAYALSESDQMALTCFDASTGRALWHVSLPERASFTALTITDRYVFLHNGFHADTFALADGRKLARIGSR